MTASVLSSRVDALDVFVELLSELDDDGGSSSREFYDRLCEAVCRLTSMRRAGLLLYDDTRKLVVPVGSHGLQAEVMEQAFGVEPPRFVAPGEAPEVEERAGEYLPYFRARNVFATTRRSLRFQAPPLASYFPALMEYARRSRWGKRPLARWEALAR